MRKRSRSAIAATRNPPATAADAVSIPPAPLRSPPLKKRAVGGAGAKVVEPPPQLERETPLSSRSASPVSSTSPTSSPAELRDGFPNRDVPTRKRGRAYNSDDVARDRTRPRCRDDKGNVLPIDASASDLDTPATPAKSPAAPHTNRTLVFDVNATPCAEHGGTDAHALSQSTPASPPRRNVVLLTSTPAFLRSRKPPADVATGTATTRNGMGNNSNNNDSDQASPLRFMRAAHDLVLSPARSTLLRGFSHLRQSVLPGGFSPVVQQPHQQQQQQQQQQQRQQQRENTSPPLSPSFLGRLSSIQPLRHHLPSLPFTDARSASSRSSHLPHRSGEVAASAQPPPERRVPSIPGSHRSSVSASEGWPHDPRRVQRPTIQRDPDDWLDSTASVHTVPASSSSLSSSRTPSPMLRGYDEADRNARHRHHRHHHHHHDSRHTREDDGHAARGSVTALAGPVDARYASVSSLSESLANVISSSRSTAQSSLTSAGAAAGGELEAAQATSLPRRSATVMSAPDVSSILPDAEERAIRRRMQRHGRDRPLADAQPTRMSAKPPRPPPLPLPSSSSSNVLELRTRPPPPPPSSSENNAQDNARRHSAHAASNLTGRHNAAHGDSRPINGSVTPGHEGSGAPAGARELYGGPRAFHSVTVLTPLRRLIGRATRALFGLSVTIVVLWCFAIVAWPLLATQAPYAVYISPSAASALSSSSSSSRTLPSVPASSVLLAEAAFLATHVNPVSDLQALYQIAPASLDVDGVARLHGRTLSEGVERLERATQHLAPHASTPPRLRLLYLRSMIRAYLVVQRNSLLYARSRDRSRWRRLIRYPYQDIMRYGLHRFASWTRDAAVRRGLLAEWRDRVVTALACSAQSELVSCPSVAYVETAMARAAAPFVYTDVNEALESPQRRRRQQEWRTRLLRDWESEVYLETLLSYLRSSVRALTRDYNR